jgi:hypothetical protein
VRPDNQKEQELPPELADLSDDMTKQPASVKRTILISVFLPGMGEVYQGNVRKGPLKFITTLIFCVLSILTSRIFFLDGPV